jgi:hypothetical protein
MKQVFSNRPGICYFPIHTIDWIATPAVAAFCLWFFIAIDRNSYPANGTLPHFFVCAGCIAFRRDGWRHLYPDCNEFLSKQ